MKGTQPLLALVAFSGSVLVAVSCSDPHADDDDQCYFVDEMPDYLPPSDHWCDHPPDEPFALAEEHCPAGNCVDTFITCDEVPQEQACESCPADELDRKVLVALGALYESRCPDDPQGLIDFERGCTFESDLIPPSTTMKHCCYTALVVGECSLMGT